MAPLYQPATSILSAPVLTGNATAVTAAAQDNDTSVATTAFVQAAQPLLPQGRLTLVTATPVMVSDQTAKTSIFYALHIGDKIPIYDGTSWAMKTFTELTLSLDTSNHLLNFLYDVFIWNNAGTIAIGSGPAWINTATVTWTSATPGVCTWTTHGLKEGDPVIFTAGTSTPTGITAGTTYYVSPTGLTASAFSVSTSVANAAAGTNVATSSTGVGTQTGTNPTKLRGTGAGTTELERKNGILTNKNSITLKNGAGAGTSGIAANTATYVGTFYCTANGQTGMAMKPAGAGGGSNNILGLFNAYNQVPVTAVCRDTTASWTKVNNTWASLDANVSNRVWFLDGLAQEVISALIYSPIFTTANVASSDIAVNLDSTTTTPNLFGSGQTNATANVVMMATCSETFLPVLGLHYIQAMQCNTGNTGTATFVGNNREALVVELEM